jgi:hypothetical protein
MGAACQKESLAALKFFRATRAATTASELACAMVAGKFSSMKTKILLASECEPA